VTATPPFLGMSRPRYTPGRALGAPRVLVIHATAGSYPGDRNWLHKGGGEPPLSPVSCHYLVAPDGWTVQLVKEGDTAWHTGAAAWPVDGALMQGSHKGVARMNHVSIGIELSNLNTGTAAYPARQVQAAVDLARAIVRRWNIPPAQMVRHRDISPGRKTDPAPPALDWEAFRRAVYAEPAVAFTADSTLVGRAVAPDAEVIRAWAKLCRARGTPYTDHDLLHVIGPEYAKLCNLTGLRLPLVLAQVAHETGWLTSFWAQRPQRNPAGIGVNGEKRQTEPQQSGWAFNPQRQQWEKGLSFPTWQEDAIPAHVGRLLAFALPPGERFGPVVPLVDKALRWRALPLAYQGKGRTLAELGRIWANPGLTYGARVADTANAILGEI
jgi:N-acetyl-anhydromuramyl-L-alanine amidase AmpD